MGRIGPYCYGFASLKLAPRLRSVFCCSLRSTLRLSIRRTTDREGFVGGAAGQGFTNMHGPTLSVSNPIENIKIYQILGHYHQSSDISAHKINALLIRNQNHDISARKCGRWAKMLIHFVQTLSISCGRTCFLRHLAEIQNYLNKMDSLWAKEEHCTTRDLSGQGTGNPARIVHLRCFGLNFRFDTIAF